MREEPIVDHRRLVAVATGRMPRAGGGVLDDRNLEALLGQGQFTFIGLPMKMREGTASPIRAVAVFGL